MGRSEIEFFTKQMESNIKRAYQGKTILTSFLDENQQQTILDLPKQQIEIIMNGGFIGAERKRVLFKPIGIDIVSYKIKVFEILYNAKYLSLHHRKVLGSLLSLGIKRESLGDIVFMNGKVFFSCTEEISNYIIATFKTISGIPIELREEDKILEIKKEIREETHFVSSMRLDAIIASAYKVSRADASAMILEGFVSINHKICLNTSKIVSESDIISVRHKGRIYVGVQGGKTKSGRLIIKLGFLV